MSNTRKRSYPRSLDDLCGSAWDLGYAAAQNDAADGTTSENPYYNYEEQE
jgi:hypothetical protein